LEADSILKDAIIIITITIKVIKSALIIHLMS